MRIYTSYIPYPLTKRLSPTVLETGVLGIGEDGDSIIRIVQGLNRLITPFGEGNDYIDCYTHTR